MEQTKRLEWRPYQLMTRRDLLEVLLGKFPAASVEREMVAELIRRELPEDSVTAERLAEEHPDEEDRTCRTCPFWLGRATHDIAWCAEDMQGLCPPGTGRYGSSTCSRHPVRRAEYDRALQDASYRGWKRRDGGGDIGQATQPAQEDPCST